MIGRFLEWFVTRLLARAFPSRYRVIPRRSDGKPLLRQFKLFETAAGNGVYIQSFVRGEERELFHCHRWRRMVSIVLSGAFMEERYPGAPYGPRFGGRFLVLHAAPSVYTMDWTTIHRLDDVMPRTWTLFFMWGNREDWGYFARPNLVEYWPWNEAIPKERQIGHFGDEAFPLRDGGGI